MTWQSRLRDKIKKSHLSDSVRDAMKDLTHTNVIGNIKDDTHSLPIAEFIGMNPLFFFKKKEIFEFIENNNNSNKKVYQQVVVKNEI